MLRAPSYVTSAKRLIKPSATMNRMAGLRSIVESAIGALPSNGAFQFAGADAAPAVHILQVRHDLEHRKVMMHGGKLLAPEFRNQLVRGSFLAFNRSDDLVAPLAVMVLGHPHPLAMAGEWLAMRRQD